MGIYQVKVIWNSVKCFERVLLFILVLMLPWFVYFVEKLECCVVQRRLFLSSCVMRLKSLLYFMYSKRSSYCFALVFSLKIWKRESAENAENLINTLIADPSLGSIAAVCLHAFMLADFNKRYSLGGWFCALYKLDAVFC